MFMNEPLLSVFGYRNDTPSADAVLQGTFQPPPTTPPAGVELLKAMQADPPLPHISFRPRKIITTDDHIKAFKKVKERTSAGMSGLHFGHFKTNTHTLHTFS